MSAPVIGFIGLTHLGLVSAAAAAEKGFVTVCMDPDPELIARLTRGDLPVVEAGLPELFAANSARLTFTTEAATVAGCDIVYIAPDVATDDAGQSDLSAVEESLETTFENARDDATIVILSQVPPGFTRARSARPQPLIYQVETLIFGNAVARALEPERFIIGARDPDAGLPDSYREFLESFDCPQIVMRYESAELAKISINCFLAASISTTNTLAELCETVGADWSEIAPALRLDKRIGPHAYLAPGLGIAGGNLERDLVSVCRMADAQYTDASVVSAWLANSAHRKGWPYRVLRERVLAAKPEAKIAVLGLAYKENTDSTKNAPSRVLLKELSGAEVTVFDPVVLHCDFADVEIAPTALTAAQGADAVVILTPWDAFRSLDVMALAAAMAGCLVLDPFAVLDRGAAKAAGLDYVTLGVSEPDI